MFYIFRNIFCALSAGLVRQAKRFCLYAVLFSSSVFTGCSHTSDNGVFSSDAVVDLDSIVRRRAIRAVVDYNSLNYFVHKGTAVGYQYELLQQYASHLGVALEIVADNTLPGGYSRLRRGEVDIFAASLVADSSLIPPMALCEPYGRSRVVLVGHESDETNGGGWNDTDTVAVMSHSFYSHLLERVADTSRSKIHVLHIEHYDAEQLVGLVAERELKSTVCLENIANANKWYYDSLTVGVALTDELDLSWGVRQSSPQLQKDISRWMKNFKKTMRFKKIYRKYVIDPREHHSVVQSTKADTYVDTYEQLTRSICNDKRYNWILVSSLMYQESHFNKNARSWAGAMGLMQLMPETAARFGVDDASDPIQSIAAGFRFLLWLDARLEDYVPDPKERVKFVLASYNVGLGHVMDAMRLAKKFGKETSVWTDNVETALLLKANPTYYSDPVVRYGFCRATETVAYVKSVMDRYANYKRVLTSRKQRR